MPSAYCRANPFNNNCLINPDFTPSVFNTGQGIEIITYPSIINNGSNLPPIKIQSTTGGVNVSSGTTTLDKVFTFIPQVLAILKGSAYVPTTEQPQQQQINYPVGYNPYGAGLGLGDTDTSGVGNKLEKFVTENSTLLLIGAGLLVLVQMKPISRRNPVGYVQNGIKQLIK